MDSQEYEAKGIKPCTIQFSRLTNEYIQWWTGKDHDRVRLVLFWEKLLGKTLLSDITPEIIRDALKQKKSLAPATYNKHLAVLSAIRMRSTLPLCALMCWRRLKIDHPYRLKIDQGELLYSVLYSIGIVDQTELVLAPFFY